MTHLWSESFACIHSSQRGFNISVGNEVGQNCPLISQQKEITMRKRCTYSTVDAREKAPEKTLSQTKSVK